MIDGKEYAKQMRVNAVTDNNGNIIVSKELWQQIANVIETQQAEIDRLKAEKDNLIKTYAECQIDFLRGFADKLKAFSFYTLNDLEVVDIDYINNLVKEMVGQNEDND